MAADPIWASVNADGTFVSESVKAGIEGLARTVVDPLRALVMGVRLTPGADMDTVTLGAYRVISATDAATILNRPPGAVAAQAAHVKVISATESGLLRVQRWQIVPSASTPALVWERHQDSAGVWSAWRQVGPDATTLVGGEDIRALQPGPYVVPTYGVASSLVNRPTGTLAWGLNPSTITVTGSASQARTITLRTAPTATEQSRTLVMHRDNGGTWSPWYEPTPPAAPAGRVLTAGEDYHTLPAGSYIVPTLAVGGSMLNGPSGALSWAKGASTVTVVAGTAKNASILLVETPAAGQTPRMAVKHRDNSGAWGDWNQVGGAPASAPGSAGRVLTVGEDYHTLPAGPYIVPTLAVGQSLLNGPTGALSWAKGAATVTVVAGDAKNVSILLVETPAAAQQPRMAVKHRDNSGTWGPWNQIGGAPATTSAPTGEAALPTLAPLAAVQHAAARTAVRLMADTLDADHPARWTAPAGTKLTIPTPDGTGQAVHPKVLDTGVPGFGGYRFWMAMTPYAFADDSLEDPCLIVSQDGTAWQAAPGAPTPLDDQPGSPEHYNSDTHLVLRGGTMYAIWRTSKNGTAPDRISWRTSTDGKAWTPTRVIYEGGALGTVYGQTLSPALLTEGTGWRMYLVAPNTHPNRLFYVTTSVASPSPADWSAPVICTLDGRDTHIPGRDVWHIDVVQDASGWWMLINDCIPRTGGIDGDLILARATDGTTWTSGRGPLLPRVASHHDALYRGSLIPREDGTIDVWYSARVRENQRWSISRTTAQKDC